MSDIAITVENLGKEYRIGTRERHDTLRDAIAGRLRRRDHGPGASERATIDHGPSSIVHGPSGGPSSIVHGPAPASSSSFWALKDVSFEVRKGEVVGVIGRNGAGKSTLLKILSRITEPTTGRAVIHGRVGSLLEVGTGFHPELTGRENIYLNGAILGMRRTEIDRRFDEIVAFSEIERFLDTPVKRYSSGMYVRLAFAVAAHLDPEVLIVDEVLAVGDAAFQKKCLGKMGDVAGEGRTVIFVSHNMEAVRALTQNALLLTDGSVDVAGKTESVTKHYLSQFGLARTAGEIDVAAFHREPIGDSLVSICAVWLESSTGVRRTTFDMGDGSVVVKVLIQATREVEGVNVSFALKNESGTRVVLVYSPDKGFEADLGSGRYVVTLELAGLPLPPGQYFADVGLNRSAWNKAFDVVRDVPLLQIREPDWLVDWIDRPWGSVHWDKVTWSVGKAE